MKYFIYCRKSTEDKKMQIQSIDDQKKVLLKISQERNLEVVDIISDEKSAKSPGRLGFQNMIKEIKKKKAQGILTWKLDRLARNPIDGAEITWLLQNEKIKEIITPEKTYHPTDNVILMSIEFGMANQYIIDLRKNVKRGLKSKIEKGWRPTKAPIGYLNEKYAEKGNKRILEDPELFPVIKKLWTLALSEKFSPIELYRHMKEKFPIYRKGKIIALSSYHRIFKNPFYAGIILYNQEKLIGKHKPMVSIREFEKIQKIFSNKKDIRYRTLDFSLKGLFQCGTCGAILTAERQIKTIKSTGKKKTFIYYKCSHKKRDIECHETMVSEWLLEEQILEEIEKMQIPNEIIDFGLEVLKEKEISQTETIQQKHLSRQIQGIQEKIKNGIDSLMQEQDLEIKNMIKTRIQEMKIEKKKITEDLELISKKKKNKKQEIQGSLDFAKKAEELFLKGDKEDKRDVISFLGSNWTISNKKVSYKANYLAKALEKTKHFMKSQKTMLEPERRKLQTDESIPQDLIHLTWSGKRDSNPRPQPWQGCALAN